MLLEDKVAIITGAASARGLGFATAKLFAENGASVVILDLNGEASKAAAAALKPSFFLSEPRIPRTPAVSFALFPVSVSVISRSSLLSCYFTPHFEFELWSDYHIHSLVIDRKSVV